MGRFRGVLILTLFTGFVVTSCNEADELSLQDTDMLALQGMEDAYLGAATHQDALMEAVEENDSVLIQRHDSLFHHYVTLFEHHHTDYSHSYSHDDHRHDSNGMHMMGGMHMHDLWQDGHHEAEHELMEDLLIEHDHVMHD